MRAIRGRQPATFSLLALSFTAACSACSADLGTPVGAAPSQDAGGAPPYAIDGGTSTIIGPDAGAQRELDTALVVDLNARLASSNPSGFVAYRGGPVFGADGSDGSKIVATDGTPAGTRVMLSLPSGVSSPSPLGALGGHLLFAATDAAHGAELWSTDASGASPTLLADANPGAEAGSPRAVGMIGTTFYFIAQANGGSFLWRTDGTAAGTAQVSIVPVGLQQIAIVGSRVFFASTAATPLENGSELWSSDGTSAGTTIVKDINPGVGDASPKLLSAIDSTLLFFADDGVHGNELWKTDGTAANTVLVADINPGPGDGGSRIVLARTGITLKETAYFQAQNASSGFELFKTDGTTAGTVLVKDINPGLANGQPQTFAIYGSRVYFSAADPTHGRELWSTDGSAAGTALVADLVPGPGNALLSALAVGPHGLVTTFNNAGRIEIWSSDGTASGTKRLSELPDPYFPVTVGSHVFFSAADADSMGSPYVTDGTTAGTTRLTSSLQTATGSSNISPIAATDTHAFFEADNVVDGRDLYATDGTAGGTFRLTSATEITRGGGYTTMSSLGGVMYFSMSDAAHGSELWRSDGTPSGTTFVKDLDPTGDGVYSVAGTVLGSYLYFCASDGVHGRELWRTDGTSSGTVMMSDMNVGAGDGCIDSNRPFLFGGKLFYQGADQTFGSIFVTDGVLTTRISPAGVYYSGYTLDGRAAFIPDGGTLYILAGGVMGGPVVPGGLWKTDGTLAGTSFVTNVYPNGEVHVGSSFLFATADQVGVWNGTAFTPFDAVGAATDLVGVGGGALWLGGNSTAGWGAWWSDGTAKGTTLLAPLETPPLFPRPQFLQLGARTYFTAGDSVSGSEIWSTDGTASRTYLAADVNPGAADSGATGLTPFRDGFLFVADDGAHGRELMIAHRRVK